MCGFYGQSTASWLRYEWIEPPLALSRNSPAQQITNLPENRLSNCDRPKARYLECVLTLFTCNLSGQREGGSFETILKRVGLGKSVPIAPVVIDMVGRPIAF